MIELANKLIDILKSIAPALFGWFVAKQDSKIEKLEKENETLKRYDEIDNKQYARDDIYDKLLEK